MTPAERKHFRALAHALKPVVATGRAGLTGNVLTAIDEALNRHELMKIRLASNLRAQRKSDAEQICLRSGAELVQLIGKIALIYRKKPDNLDE